MTERLYYSDSYLRGFTARVVGRSPDGCTVYLDRTAFYPTSGGQPFDTGKIGGAAVLDVVDEEDRVAHRVGAPVRGETVECLVDWDRRFDHMQQHTGQHLLSAVFNEEFGLETVSFHLGQDASTIDLEGGALDARTLREAERRANRIVCENRPVTVEFRDASEAEGLRKASGREGTLRIVSIAELDRSACGGTHVRATGEIGPVLVRKSEKIRNSVRVEFLCGTRAVGRARADFEALSKIAQAFSSPLDDAPTLAVALIESAAAQDKLRRKLELDLAAYRGRELYDSTGPDAEGIRRAVRRMAKGSMDDLRALAQSFTAQPMAVFLGVLEDPPALLYATSADTGIDAGKALKAAVTECGGRGGGAARLAQGGVPSRELLERATEKL